MCVNIYDDENNDLGFEEENDSDLDSEEVSEDKSEIEEESDSDLDSEEISEDENKAEEKGKDNTQESYSDKAKKDREEKIYKFVCKNYKRTFGKVENTCSSCVYLDPIKKFCQYPEEARGFKFLF